MFIEKMLNEGTTPVLEQMLRFTAARGNLLTENVVNISTPGYHQKDLDLHRFQQMLAERVERRNQLGTASVNFSDISQEVEDPRHGILFHDGSNKPMEQLMSDEAKNTLMNNLAIELLRQQFQTLQMALKERVS